MERKRIRNNGTGRWKISCFIAALVASVAVFIVMLQLEKKVLSDYGREQTYVAIKSVPRGKMITAQNFADFFELRELDSRIVPKTAIRNSDEITELIPCYDIEEGTVVTRGMFTDMTLAVWNMKEPVIAGLKADDLYQVAGGQIRAGDRIDVYRVDDENEAKPVWENLYVQSVSDQSGIPITGGDNNSLAHRINVYMDKEDVAFFYSELSKGTLRVVKEYELK